MKMSGEVGEVTIKNSVRVARAEQNLTQQEVADRVGVTRQTIGLIENHKYNPTISFRLRLAIALEKDLGELFWAEVNDS
jgi:putative transcriptional regulator